MKTMVLVLGFVAVPWARWWISVPLACCQRWPSELLMSLAYSARSPVSGLKALPWCAVCGGAGAGAGQLVARRVQRWGIGEAESWNGSVGKW